MHTHSGKIGILAADHELTVGHLGFPPVEELVRIACQAKIPSIVLTPGLAEGLDEYLGVNLIVQCMGGPANRSVTKEMICTVERALGLGATAISLQSSFLTGYDSAEVETISQMVEKAKTFSLPTMLMISGEPSERRNLKDAVAYSKSIGIDILKIPYCEDAATAKPDGLKLVMSGGEADAEISQKLDAAYNLGFDGFCIGRSIIFSEDPVSLGRQLCAGEA